MNTWTPITAMVGTTEILLDLLDVDGRTAGWIVRRSCNVFQAFVPPEKPENDQVVELENDGELVGIFPDQELARQAIIDHLEIKGPQFVMPDSPTVSV